MNSCATVPLWYRSHESDRCQTTGNRESNRPTVATMKCQCTQFPIVRARVLRACHAGLAACHAPGVQDSDTVVLCLGTEPPRPTVGAPQLATEPHSEAPLGCCGTGAAAREVAAGLPIRLACNLAARGAPESSVLSEALLTCSAHCEVWYC